MSQGAAGDGIRRADPRLDPRRVDYDGDGLTEDALLDTPYAQARAWVDDAVARAQESPDVFEPLAISVATVDGDGRPERAHRAHALPRRARARGSSPR